jgi:hypothetical protein
LLSPHPALRADLPRKGGGRKSFKPVLRHVFERDIDAVFGVEAEHIERVRAGFGHGLRNEVQNAATSIASLVVIGPKNRENT